MLRETASGQTISPESALTLVDVYAAVRCLSDLTGSLPLIAYRRTQSGRVRIETGRLPSLLQNPAPGVTQGAFLAQVMGHLQTWGNAFIGKYRGADGEVQQLGLLSPDRVQVELRNGDFRYTYHRLDGPPTVHMARDIRHIRTLLSLDGLSGLSPLSQCREGIGLSSALTEHAARFFSNGAVPAGILRVSSGPIASDQLENLRRDFEARHKGTGGAHRVALMVGDVEYAPLSVPLQDLQFLELRRLSSTEVARAFRIPAWALDCDSGSSMTYANVTEQARSLITFSLRPWLVCIESALSLDEDLFKPNEYCEFLLDGILRGDPESRWRVYDTAVKMGAMSIAEVRERKSPAARDKLGPRPFDKRRHSGGRMTELEQRTIDVDVRDLDTRGHRLHGFASVYGVESHDLGGFREKIAAGAFSDVLGADVRCS